MPNTTIDLTPYKHRGVFLVSRLMKLIQETIDRGDELLPNKLILTYKQFKSIERHFVPTDSKDKTKDRIYVTKLNAMEVEVI